MYKVNDVDDFFSQVEVDTDQCCHARDIPVMTYFVLTGLCKKGYWVYKMFYDKSAFFWEKNKTGDSSILLYWDIVGFFSFSENNMYENSRGSVLFVSFLQVKDFVCI